MEVVEEEEALPVAEEAVSAEVEVLPEVVAEEGFNQEVEVVEPSEAEGEDRFLFYSLKLVISLFILDHENALLRTLMMTIAFQILVFDILPSQESKKVRQLSESMVLLHTETSSVYKHRSVNSGEPLSQSCSR